MSEIEFRASNTSDERLIDSSSEGKPSKTRVDERNLEQALDKTTAVPSRLTVNLKTLVKKIETRAQAKHLRIRIIAITTFILTHLALGLLVSLNMLTLDTLSAGLREATSPLIVLSVTLIVFPFVSVSGVESIVSRAQSLGIKVNQKLVEDYVDGCFIVFLLSVAELISLVLYVFTDSVIIVYITIPLLITLVFITIILLSGLWEIAKMMIKIIPEFSQT